MIRAHMQDPVPGRTMTMCTRRTELQMSIEIEISVQTERVINERRLYSEYDLFQIGGIEKALDAPLECRSISIDGFRDLGFGISWVGGSNGPSTDLGFTVCFWVTCVSPKNCHTFLEFRM